MAHAYTAVDIYVLNLNLVSDALQIRDPGACTYGRTKFRNRSGLSRDNALVTIALVLLALVPSAAVNLDPSRSIRSIRSAVPCGDRTKFSLVPVLSMVY
eukprot:SAG31_NODE_23163_length_509_cov_98.673171_1_plen_99_part_00